MEVEDRVVERPGIGGDQGWRIGLADPKSAVSSEWKRMLPFIVVGTTIGMGLLVDTLVIRSFMTPSIAALMGRWFWWPKVVSTHAAKHAATPTPTREPEPEHAGLSQP